MPGVDQQFILDRVDMVDGHCVRTWSQRLPASARCPLDMHRCVRDEGHGAEHRCRCGATRPNPGVPVRTNKLPFAGIEKIELAWAAGFFDGEGTCVVRINNPDKNRHGHGITLSVAQIDPEPLERFRSAVGGLGKVEGPYTHEKWKGNPKHRPQWVYRVSSFEEVQAVAALLWGFICGPKKTQFRRCITSFVAAPRTRVRRSRSRLGC